MKNRRESRGRRWRGGGVPIGFANLGGGGVKCLKKSGARGGSRFRGFFPARRFFNGTAFSPEQNTVLFISNRIAEEKQNSIFPYTTQLHRIVSP